MLASLPGLSELRAQAIRTRQPFDHDTEVGDVHAIDRYTFRVHLGEPDPRIELERSPHFRHSVYEGTSQGFWRHPFMRDVWRFVDPGPQR